MDKRDIKNIIVVNDYDFVQGGASLVAITMANVFEKNGYNVYFFCGVSNPQKSTLNKNVKVISCRKKDFLNSKRSLSNFFSGLFSFANKNKFLQNFRHLSFNDTVVFIHGRTKALGPSFIEASWKLKFKNILTLHDYFSICSNGGLFNYKTCKVCPLNSNNIKCLLVNCDSRNFLFKIYRQIRYFIQDKILHFRSKIYAIITISKTSEKLLAKYFQGKQIFRILNPTNSIEKKDFIPLCGKHYYVYVGRVDKEKGVENLCYEFQNINEKLLIVGDGNLLNSLKEKKYKNIYFAGWKDHPTTMNLIQNSKGLIFPSLWYEGAPLTIFEALSVGRPCIVSNICSGKEFIDGKNGWIFNPLHEGELSTLISNINVDDLEQKGEYAFKHFWENPFSIELYEYKLLELLKTINE